MKRIHRIFRINVKGLGDKDATDRIEKFKEGYTKTPNLNYLDYFIPVRYGDNSLEIVETES